VERDENDPVVQWMEFLDARTKGEIEMLVKKNKDIKKAYDLLQVISKDEKARMLYEAQQAEISDQLTRIKSAEAKGRAEGKAEGEAKGEAKGKVVAKEEDAINFLKLGVDEEVVAKGTGLSIKKVQELKKKYQN